ncbi:MAG: aldo/keto reductase, partial [Verrucomicrobiota bacterium]
GAAIPKGSRAADGFGPSVFTPENLEIVEKLIAFAEERNRSVLELAFGWLLSHPSVASVIAGASKPEQARANAAAAGWKLTAADLARIDTILPES